MKRWTVPISLFIILILTHLVYTYNQHRSAVIIRDVSDTGEINQSEYVKGRVVEVLNSYPVEGENSVAHILKVELLGGRYKGKKIIMRNLIRPRYYPRASIWIKKGDVFLCKVGGMGDNIRSLNAVQEYNRDGIIIILAGFLMMLIILVGRYKGIRTVISLIIAGVVIYFVMLPTLHNRANPLLIAMRNLLSALGLETWATNPLFIVPLTCGIITATSLLIIAGFGRKTYSAILGTMGGVVVATIIVIYAQSHLCLSGMESYNAAEIIESEAGKHLDLRRLLLAGMILGLLGAAMDGAIDVASSMEEVRRANPKLGRLRLIQAGMNVGTDVIGTMANTLIFAYFGLRLLLVLTSVGTPLFTTTNMQLFSVGVVSAEIVRILAGSIGLVITIPITVLISGFWRSRLAD